MLEKIDAKKYQRILKLARVHPNVDVSSLEAMIALHIVADKVGQEMECNLGRYNLSRGRFRVLLELAEAAEAGLAPADLANRIEVSRGTMTGLLDTLEKTQLVTREASSEDRRTILIKITPTGADFAKRVLPDNFIKYNSMMKFLSLRDKEALVDLLAKVMAGVAASKEE